MAISREDMAEIKEELDERYVLVPDCNARIENVNKKFANDDKRIDLLIHKFSSIEKILWVVATACVGSLITALFNLILR